MPDHSSSSSWHLLAYTRLRFFTRIRRLLHVKSSNKRYQPSDQTNKPRVAVDDHTCDQENLKQEEDDWVVVLQRSVKRLHFGSWQEKEVAVREIKRLAGEDLKRRKMMAELGVIPPLVEMVGSEVVDRRRLAIQALIQLANGTCKNKALMVEAGILSKLPENTGMLDEQTRHDFGQLVLSISSLANSQLAINSSKFVPFTISIFESDSNLGTKEMCLGTLFNLSTTLNNVATLVSNDVIISHLIRLSSIKETSEKALATLGNLVVTLMGKKALETNPLVPESLIEIMTWEDKPKSQELSAYILMILAYKSCVQRSKMAKAGIVPVLLQVSLLSSPLAQKRATKLLQWLIHEERHTKMGPHSGPQTRRLCVGSPVNDEEGSEGKKLIKKMVRQSLYKNMETITRRANGEGGSSSLKFLVVSSSSKSLPY